MTKIILWSISIFFFVHNNHYAVQTKCFFDVGIVYKDDSYECVDQLPLYTWLSRIQRFSVSGLFSRCKNSLLDLSDVACTQDEHKLKSKNIKHKIFVLCAELPSLSDADRIRYQALWAAFKVVLSAKMDVDVQSIKNKKNCIASSLLYFFPTQAKRNLFCTIMLMYHVVFMWIFIELSLVKNHSGCRSIAFFLTKCFFDAPFNSLHGFLGYSMWLGNIVVTLLFYQASEFVDVEQALHNKQIVMHIVQDIQRKFLKYKQEYH